MYDLKEVRQVNKSYVFFTFADGTQDRKKPVKYELEWLLKDVKERISHLKFVWDYGHAEYERIHAEYEKEKEHLEYLEQYIEYNQDNPLVKRGLHEVVWNREWTLKEMNEISCKCRGISEMTSKSLDERYFYERLQKQIEATLREM